MPLQSIRAALDFAGQELDEDRPLLTAKFKIHGKSLFLKFAADDPYFVNASLRGQFVWPQTLEGLFESVEYDRKERAAFRWWPLGQSVPVLIDTRLNGGQPSTSMSGVRTLSIASRKRQGFNAAQIVEDVAASTAEAEAALRFERLALAA